MPAPQELIGMILEPLEMKLFQPDRMSIAERLAVTHAHQHVYEALYWINAAQVAGRRIVAP